MRVSSVSGAGTIAALGLTAAVVLSAALAACAAPDRLDDPDAGRTLAYDPDALDFDLEARATLADSVPGLHALVAFDPASLVFEAAAGAQEARYQLVIGVREEASGRLVREQIWTDTLRASNAEAPPAAPPVLHEVRWGVSPGTYLVEARLDDLGVQRSGLRQLRLAVPDTDSAAAVGRVLVEVKRNGRYVPHLGRALDAPDDSLRLRLDARSGAAPSTVVLRIARLPSDTTVARPPHWLGPSRGSVVYQGVRMAEGIDVFESAPLQLRGADSLTVVIPPLGEGLYLIRAEMEQGGEAVDAATRHLAVFAPGHPQVETLDQLIEALAYIAYERELAFIQAGATPADRRAAYDAFWGTLIGDRRVASNVIRLYYERVEEANRRFSTVKPGWMTDRGMLFVLLGPPVYVQPDLDGETWFYGEGLRRDATTFRFLRSTDFGQPVGWRPFVLERQAAYEQVWSSSLRRWRRGRML